jgi:hypothetical protein
VYNTDLNQINLNGDDIPESWVNPDRNIVYNQNSKQDCNIETSNVFGDSSLQDYITNSRADSNEVENNNNSLINNVDNVNTNQYNLNQNGDGNNSSNH